MSRAKYRIPFDWEDEPSLLDAAHSSEPRWPVALPETFGEPEYTESEKRNAIDALANRISNHTDQTFKQGRERAVECAKRHDRRNK